MNVQFLKCCFTLKNLERKYISLARKLKIPLWVRNYMLKFQQQLRIVKPSKVFNLAYLENFAVDSFHDWKTGI